METKEHHGFLLGMLAALTIAVSGVLIRLAAAIPFETMIFARFAISLLFVLPAIFSGRVSFQAGSLGKHFLRAMFGLLSMYSYFYIVLQMPLVDAMTFLNIAPLFMPVLLFFLDRLIIPKARVGVLFIGFVGVVLILRPSEGFFSWVNIIGLSCGLFAAMSQLGIRQLVKIESTETILSYYFVLSAFVSFFPMIYAWKPIDTPINWLYLLLIGVFSLLYQILITKALAHTVATKVATMNYFSVVFSGLLGWWFFHEVPSYWILAGVVCILVGGLIAFMNKDIARKW